MVAMQPTFPVKSMSLDILREVDDAPAGRCREVVADVACLPVSRRFNKGEGRDRAKERTIINADSGPVILLGPASYEGTTLG